MDSINVQLSSEYYTLGGVCVYVYIYIYMGECIGTTVSSFLSVVVPQMAIEG